jgi:DNA-3-methyladenine glycosylase
MTPPYLSLPVLPRRFYAQSTIAVAQGLLGQAIVHGELAARIVEVEAYVPSYQGQPDLAAHAWRGLTPRTRVLFGPPGHAYVYLIYGLYDCLNITTEPEGIAGFVLIRAVEPLTALGPTNGPGKLTRALGVTRQHYAHDLLQPPLTIRRLRQPAEPIHASPRIGIRRCATWPLRFFLAGNPYVSGRPSATHTAVRLP